MWDNLSESIGMQKCTPFGYVLNNIARLLGVIGLYLLLGLIIFFLLYRPVPTFWFFTVPFIIGFIAQILFLYSWHLAEKKGFEYNEETREASWYEDEKRIVYKWVSTEKDK
jgi:hypothetical protein